MVRSFSHLCFLNVVRLFLLSQQIKFWCLRPYSEGCSFCIALFGWIYMFIKACASGIPQYLVPLLLHFLLELSALPEDLSQTLLKYGLILRLIHLAQELQVL